MARSDIRAHARVHSRANASRALILIVRAFYSFIFMALKILYTLDCMQAQRVLHFSASLYQQIHM